LPVFRHVEEYDAHYVITLSGCCPLPYHVHTSITSIVIFRHYFRPLLHIRPCPSLILHVAATSRRYYVRSCHYIRWLSEPASASIVHYVSRYALFSLRLRASMVHYYLYVIHIDDMPCFMNMLRPRYYAEHYVRYSLVHLFAREQLSAILLTCCPCCRYDMSTNHYVHLSANHYTTVHTTIHIAVHHAMSGSLAGPLLSMSCCQRSAATSAMMSIWRYILHAAVRWSATSMPLRHSKRPYNPRPLLAFRLSMPLERQRWSSVAWFRRHVLLLPAPLSGWLARPCCWRSCH